LRKNRIGVKGFEGGAVEEDSFLPGEGGLFREESRDEFSEGLGPGGVVDAESGRRGSGRKVKGE